MNSRRLIVAPRGSKPRTASSHSRPGLGMGRGGCELRPIVLGWQCRLWGPTTGVKTRKAQYQQMLFRFAPDRRPIELLPPPALRERRHSCLARRLVAVCRRAILMMSKGERPHPRRAYRRGVDLEDAVDDGGRWQWGRARNRRARACPSIPKTRVRMRRPQARRTRVFLASGERPTARAGRAVGLDTAGNSPMHT